MDVIAFFEQEFGIILTHQSGNEWAGPCPFCVPGKVTGVDRLRVWVGTGQQSIGSYWCRQCTRKGYIDKLMGGQPLSETERRLRRLEAEAERARREQEQIIQRLSAIEQLNARDDHLIYHRALDDNDRAWWHSQGIDDTSIQSYQLGVCYACPTDWEHRPSYTIPIYNSTGEKLLNIRHRLTGQVDGDRYRPHMKGLPGKLLFNAHFSITGNEALLVEGEKKSIVLEQNGYPAMGVLGINGFNLDWLKHFVARTLTLCPDPDAVQAWHKLGQQIAAEGLAVNLCILPMKPDDLFIAGGTPADFDGYLRYARKVH